MARAARLFSMSPATLLAVNEREQGDLSDDDIGAENWLAEPAGPQVVFKGRTSGRQTEYPTPCRREASHCSSRTAKLFRAPAPCLSTEGDLAVN